MTPFRATPAGFVATWEPVERQVLARVARDVAELLRADSGLPDDATDVGLAFTGVARMPRDPAVQRLLPDAHRDDADVAAEFRHLTQTDLAAGKVNRLEAFARTIDPDGLSRDDAESGSEPGADGVTDADVQGPADTGTDQVLVTREAATDFAGALTDLRLVLAERLRLDDDAAVERLHDEVMSGVPADAGAGDDSEDEDGDDAPDGEERFYWGGVFVAAGFAQETLTEEMLSELRARRANG
jgi:hypothetical protein